MDENNFDCIVIGAGIEGSSTAYNLAKRGVKTLLVEQYLLPHSRGSSSGQTRITRHAYKEPFHTQMMLEGYPEWADIEKQTNCKIYRKCGLLVLERKPCSYLPEIESILIKHKLSYHKISPYQVELHYNMSLLENYEAIVEEDAGTLQANKALDCIQSLVKKYGGKIADGVKVLQIQPGSPIKLITTVGKLTTKQLIICAGPWTPKLLSSIGLNLPLKVLRVEVYYWKEKRPDMYSSRNGFPCFMDISDPSLEFYGLPSNEYPGYVKIAAHGGVETDPDSRDEVNNSIFLQKTARFVKQHFPYLEDKPSITESCLYTVTPDEICILDRHPKHPNIMVGTGFSGTGFKLGPVVGKILTKMYFNEPQSLDMTPFSIARFVKSSL